MKKSIKAMLLLSIFMLVTAGAASANTQPIFIEKNWEHADLRVETNHREGQTIVYSVSLAPLNTPGDGEIIGYIRANGALHIQEALYAFCYDNRINADWGYNHLTQESGHFENTSPTKSN
ncbi:MAG: hypothetical protein KO464_07225 [Candidatus Methanofastidiosum sp.]|nr:hypothetical protein [Methanofastidiosum sp.]